MIPIGEKKLFLLDIDGTICVGNRLIPGADRFLNGLSEYGGDYVFITNNTTMSVAAVSYTHLDVYKRKGKV